MKNLKERFENETNFCNSVEEDEKVFFQLPDRFTKIYKNVAYNGPCVSLTESDIEKIETIGSLHERQQYAFHSAKFERQWL